MNRKFLYCVLVAFLIAGCEKATIPDGYPSTYRKLEPQVLAARQSSYLGRNQYIRTSLDQYGFCDMTGDPMNAPTPPLTAEISQAEAIDMALEFISLNKAETGVENPADVRFYQVSRSTGYGGSVYWHFRSENQVIDTVEIMDSSILVHLQNTKAVLSVGNWYPEVFIPGEFNFDIARTRDILNGRSVSHYNFGGEEYKYKITRNDLLQSTFSLKVLPQQLEDRIELRVCWRVHIPSVYYMIYVDVVTGEILMEVPTIIS